MRLPWDAPGPDRRVSRGAISGLAGARSAGWPPGAGGMRRKPPAPLGRSGLLGLSEAEAEGGEHERDDDPDTQQRQIALDRSK